MKLKCPVCGEVLEVDVDLVEGQRVSCDVCDSSFIFRKEYALVGGRRSRLSPAECQRSKQRNHKKSGCLAQLSLLVFRVALVVGAIIAVVKIVDVIFSSEVVRHVKEVFETNANSRNVTSARPQTVAATEPRPTASSVPTRIEEDQWDRPERKQVWRYDGDPLDNYLLGTYKVTRQEDFVMNGFLGFQKMKISYTSKGRIACICLTTEDSANLSVSSTDYMVDRMMKRCDLKYGPIDWTVRSQVTGAKYAKGRCYRSGKIDKIFILMPSACGGMEALLISERAQREDDGRENPDSAYDRM